VTSLASSPALDPSNGYEGVAQQFLEARLRSRVGAGSVQAWARALPEGATVLDLGCGSGVPVSRVLTNEGFTVYGVDASPTMCAAFRGAIPQAHIACEPVEQSTFFGRSFDGVIAWGLIFLLDAQAQPGLITRVAQVLVRGGRFLFTAPTQVCTWNDELTRRPSQSIGAPAYRAALESCGLMMVSEYVDEGENHYYDTVKPQ
jgi:2-polyprenyl-3-methyl-5-hydroxy-6-metoxy-1,4-benzoquinol methylase